jgi:hypothetical protein
MAAPLLTAWPQGLPTAWRPDLWPFAWGVLLLLVTRAAGVRVRWWIAAVALAGGTPCMFLADRYGRWAPIVLAALVFVALVPVGASMREPDRPD